MNPLEARPAPLPGQVLGRLLRIWFAAMAFGIGLQGIVALFPLYRDDLGLDDGDLSLVFSAYMAGVLPGIALLSPLADRHGRRAVVVPSLLISLAASILLSASDQLHEIVTGRVLQGLATGAFVAASAAWARDTMPDDRRRDAMLLMTTTSVLGVAGGIALFGGIATATGSRTVPWLVHAAVLATATALVATVPDTAARAGTSAGARFGVPAAHRPVFRRYVVPVTVPSQLTGSFALALAPTLVLETVGDATPAGTGAIATMYMGVSFLAQLGTRRITRLAALGTGGAALMAGAAAATGAAVASGSLVALWLALGALGAGHGLTFRAGMAVTESTSDDTSRARTLATYTVLFYISAALGPLLGGSLTDAVGTVPPLLLFAVLALVGALLSRRHHGLAGDPATPAAPAPLA